MDLGEVLCLGDDPGKQVREWGSETRWRGRSMKGVSLLLLWSVGAPSLEAPLTYGACLRAVQSRGK